MKEKERKTKNKKNAKQAINIENSNKFHQIYYSLQLLFNVVRINNTWQSKRLSKLKDETEQKQKRKNTKIMRQNVRRERKKWHNAANNTNTNNNNSKNTEAFARIKKKQNKEQL